MMLAARFRQVLSGICESFASLLTSSSSIYTASDFDRAHRRDLSSPSPETASSTTMKPMPSYRTLPSPKHRYDDPVLAELSARQRELQLRIYNDLKANTKNLRRERNAILHQIRLRCRDIATKLIDEKIQRIENLSGAAQMFEAVRDVTRLRTQPTVLLDDKVQKYRERIDILGIDLSRAFDTIDRHKLLAVLESFLPEDEIRLIRLLLSKTTLSLRSGHTTLRPFESNTETQQRS
eukprot:jgi/Phyca11/537836/estExt2_fgenesh1_pg.C_PHYCAscaffold_2690001